MSLNISYGTHEHNEAHVSSQYDSMFSPLGTSAMIDREWSDVRFLLFL